MKNKKRILVFLLSLVMVLALVPFTLAVFATDVVNEEGESTQTATASEDGVAKIGDVSYATLTDALAQAKAGDEIVLLADVSENVVTPAGVIFNGNGKQVGTITASGEITFKGHTRATNFSTQYTNTTINIGEDACLEITGTGKRPHQY